MRKYGRTVIPVAHNPNPNSSPFASRGQTILELAKDAARKEIQQNLENRNRK